MADRLLFDVRRPYKPRVYREHTNAEPFNVMEIQSRYRFGPQSIDLISDLVADKIERPTQRGHAIPLQTQTKMALRFYATGAFLEVIGDTFGYHKSTVSRVVHSFTDALCEKGKDFIQWPSTAQDRQRIINGFYQISRFPCVVGAVNGTHVQIQAPDTNEHMFVNRKNYHSINVQGICDHEGKFTNIVAKWPGSSHDSFIFRNSDIGIHLSRNHRGYDVDGVLLGDSGYACKPYLMTPYLRPRTRSEERYNSAHVKTRSTIERTFGRWKRRFHVLHGEIRMSPVRACKIILACAILHNFAIMQGEPLDGEEELLDVNEGVHGEVEDGVTVRNLITTNYF